MTTNRRLLEFKEHMCFIYAGATPVLPRDLSFCCLEFAGLVRYGNNSKGRSCHFVIYM